MKKRTKRMMRKAMWFILMMVAICFGVYMYFSATFLAGMLITRKVIYFILAGVAIVGFAHVVSD